MDEWTYAIGDIHGRLDLLEAALAWIAADAGGIARAHVVVLGDMVDRGPGSAGVVERLMRGPTRPGDRFTCLMGNHEAMLLDALTGDREAEALWLGNGGEATLRAYGGRVPDAHAAWLRARPLRAEDEHRVFVHAGFRPGRALAEQIAADMLWIREPFLSVEHDFGRHVVHGHTPQEGAPDLRRFRSNLDTGAVWTGTLCVAVFDPARAGGPRRIRLVQGLGT